MTPSTRQTNTITHLSSDLRSKLARVITQARQVSEQGARPALEALAVQQPAPYPEMTGEQRSLRNRLRAHGRSLGDRRSERSGGQAIEHLLKECAYEHWHRMLFARFLAENHLLIEPELNVPVTLAECEELAKEAGVDQWSLAGRFAQRMLPQIFRADHPVLEVVVAREHRAKLEELLESLPAELFTSSDALGWVYQFWQAEEKDRVNRSEVKIGAEELPAVTQLFTEPYMVHFLLHNSLGAFWVTRHPDKRCPVDLAYLRYSPVASEDGKHPIPAAGIFKGWSDDLSDLRLLDPCCGSGHFMVAAFLMLVPMRMEVEGLSAREAVDAVLRDNLHGLEIDRRCVEIAAFALALEAWRYPGSGGYRPLPPPNIAWCGQSVPSKEEEWLRLANGDRGLRADLHALYAVFRDAPLLGSLIDPRRAVTGELFEADYTTLRPLLRQALEKRVAEPSESLGGDTEESLRETAISAQGMAVAADLLSRSYHLVITNVPYLTRGKQSDGLKEFCERRYPEGKNDLANVFLERCLELCREGGVTQIVMPQNWLFLTSYRKQRERLLKEQRWELLARLGPGAFETITGEVVNVILLTLTHARPGADHKLQGLDASQARTARGKAEVLISIGLKSGRQVDRLDSPDARITLEEATAGPLLSEFADYGKGSTTGDAPRFLLHFWESPEIAQCQVPWLDSPNENSLWSGRSTVCKVPLESRELTEQLGCWLRGSSVFGRKGVAVNKMRNLAPFLYFGEVFDDNVCPICPKIEGNLLPIWTYVSSPDFQDNVRSLDQKLNVTAGTITKVPFDLPYWQRIASERYPHGLPKPFSDDPSQWIFHGHPCGSVVWDEDRRWTARGPLRTDATVLQVAVARLLGYRWPAESDAQMELADEARAWVAETKRLDRLGDADGIVCLPPIQGELPAHERLLRLLEAAWGDSWNIDALNKLLVAGGCAGKTLEVWLRDSFFEQHSALFHHRPFIWHVWDGLKDGFAVLLNYHKLDRTNLERLIYSYLGDWIRMQEEAKRSGADGAEERLAAALGLKRRLEAILKGEKPLDIFIRWKPIEAQPIGWDPDLNDGVRINIRPFLTVEDVGKRGAGILRARPNIQWQKDRGKDSPGAPWYDRFHGERINDHHLSLEEKESARR